MVQRENHPAKLPNLIKGCFICSYKYYLNIDIVVPQETAVLIG